MNDPVREALAELVACINTWGAGGYSFNERWDAAYAAARAALAQEPARNETPEQWAERFSHILAATPSDYASPPADDLTVPMIPYQQYLEKVTPLRDRIEALQAEVARLKEGE